MRKSHKSRIFGVSAGAILALSGSAFAADLPARMPVKAPMVAPVWSWTGYYVGVNAGYGFSRDREIQTTGQVPANVATVADGARPPFVNLDPSGFIGGGQIGYNWQTGSWVFGIEADLQYSDINEEINVVTTGVAFPGVRNNTFRQELEYFGTVRGRLGIAWDRTLIYGTGGLAYGSIKNSADFFGPQPANVRQFTGSVDKTEIGYTVGGGLEHAFGSNWSAKVEYLYYDLGEHIVAVNVIPGSGGGGTGYFSNFRNEGHIVRAGLNYKFGAPMVGRY
jgi:outer membrane immunogenic protein